MPTIADLMTRDVRSVSTLDVVDNVRAVLHESRIGAVPVVSPDGKLAGIVTASDLVEDWGPDEPVERVMSPEVVTLGADVSATDAATTMVTHQIHHVVVLDGDGAIAGMLSTFDLIRSLAAHVEAAEAAGPAPTAHHAPKVGDDIVIRGHAIGGHERRGRIVEIRGEGGGPPYMVQWRDDPHDEPHAVMFFPGPDADVEPAG